MQFKKLHGDIIVEGCVAVSFNDLQFVVTGIISGIRREFLLEVKTMHSDYLFVLSTTSLNKKINNKIKGNGQIRKG